MGNTDISIRLAIESAIRTVENYYKLYAVTLLSDFQSAIQSPLPFDTSTVTFFSKVASAKNRAAKTIDDIVDIQTDGILSDIASESVSNDSSVTVSDIAKRAVKILKSDYKNAIFNQLDRDSRQLKTSFMQYTMAVTASPENDVIARIKEREKFTDISTSFRDARGRKWKSERYVSVESRAYFYNIRNAAVTLSLVEQGVEEIAVTTPKGTVILLPIQSYFDRPDIFHPGSSLIISQS